ncbi:hypothetical protein GCM10009801_27990 [Streptomyces albiaxialis]|uniref:Glycosyltransferase n=1 Tax=Streptomyces albiaxialis TaxID=329523 RepID=A0ABN2VVR2_9ACTN
MSTYISPVPMPADDAEAPEVCREIYGMPAYLHVPTPDLAASADFWVRGLGFVDFYTLPGQVTHLRRWAFQDVLLVPGERAPGHAAGTPATGMAFSCVLSQIEEIAEACEKLVPGCVSGPEEMLWNSVELTVVTPENTRVVMTAARPIEPGGPAEARLREAGFDFGIPDRSA